MFRQSQAFDDFINQQMDFMSSFFNQQFHQSNHRNHSSQSRRSNRNASFPFGPSDFPFNFPEFSDFFRDNEPQYMDDDFWNTNQYQGQSRRQQSHSHPFFNWQQNQSRSRQNRNNNSNSFFGQNSNFQHQNAFFNQHQNRPRQNQQRSRSRESFNQFFNHPNQNFNFSNFFNQNFSDHANANQNFSDHANANQQRQNSQPVFGKKKLTPAEYIEQTECPICLARFDFNVEYPMLKCGHYFHKECIEPWLQSNRTCPVCRQNVF